MSESEERCEDGCDSGEHSARRCRVQKEESRRQGGQKTLALRALLSVRLAPIAVPVSQGDSQLGARHPGPRRLRDRVREISDQGDSSTGTSRQECGTPEVVADSQPDVRSRLLIRQ